jgi:agmatinase
MAAYTFQQPANFLALPPEHSEFEGSRALILPVPYEATTSYKGGTREGPQAILEASRQVELYDREFGGELALHYGIHTLPALASDLRSPEAAVASIAAAAEHFTRTGKLLGALGGEHALSIGIARGLKAVHGDFVTVQLDAHADLRADYDETPYSHACTARRIAEEVGPVVQLGIRSLDATEAEFLQKNPDRVTAHFADEMHSNRDYLPALAARIQGKKVFLTVDLDVLDPAVMPAVGTPEPGGLLWYDLLEIVRTVTANAELIAFDVVELCPQPGLHAADFTAAKLVYKILNLALKPTISRFNLLGTQ